MSVIRTAVLVALVGVYAATADSNPGQQVQPPRLDTKVSGLPPRQPADFPGQQHSDEPQKLNQPEFPLEPPSGRPLEQSARPPRPSGPPKEPRGFQRHAVGGDRQPADFPGQYAPGARPSGKPQRPAFPPLQSALPLEPPSNLPLEHSTLPPRPSSLPKEPVGFHRHALRSNRQPEFPEQDARGERPSDAPQEPPAFPPHSEPPRGFPPRGDRQPVDFPRENAPGAHPSDEPQEPRPHHSELPLEPPSDLPQEPPVRPPRPSGPPKGPRGFQRHALRGNRQPEFPGQGAEGERPSDAPREPPAFPPRQSELPLEPPSGRPLEQSVRPPRPSGPPKEPRGFQRHAVGGDRQPADFPGQDAPGARPSGEPLPPAFLPPQSGVPLEPRGFPPRDGAPGAPGGFLQSSKPWAALPFPFFRDHSVPAGDRSDEPRGPPPSAAPGSFFDFLFGGHPEDQSPPADSRAPPRGPPGAGRSHP